MPRDLPLGNGRLLINFDSRYHVRDLYYPRIGGENHTMGQPFRFGVWCDGQFGWVHDDDWQARQATFACAAPEAVVAEVLQKLAALL